MCSSLYIIQFQNYWSSFYELGGVGEFIVHKKSLNNFVWCIATKIFPVSVSL